MIEKIKILRKERGYTQEQLGRAVDVSQQAINSYENSETQPDFSVLIKLADFFNVTVDYLLDHDVRNDLPAEFSKYSFSSEDTAMIAKYLSLSTGQRRCIDPVIDMIKSPDDYK